MRLFARSDYNDGLWNPSCEDGNEDRSGVRNSNNVSESMD